jgi:hypothetical protein
MDVRPSARQTTKEKMEYKEMEKLVRKANSLPRFIFWKKPVHKNNDEKTRWSYEQKRKIKTRRTRIIIIIIVPAEC